MVTFILSCFLSKVFVAWNTYILRYNSEKLCLGASQWLCIGAILLIPVSKRAKFTSCIPVSGHGQWHVHSDDHSEWDLGIMVIISKHYPSTFYHTISDGENYFCWKQDLNKQNVPVPHRPHLLDLLTSISFPNPYQWIVFCPESWHTFIAFPLTNQLDGTTKGEI